MEQLLVDLSETTVLLVQFLALIFIMLATVRLLFDVVRMLFRQWNGQADPHASRRIWLDYARWLIAALTLQLSADIIESAIAPSWESIAQLAAIAAIRTFLNYFLEKDMHEASEKP